MKRATRLGMAAALLAASLTACLSGATSAPLRSEETTMESAKRRAPSARPVEHKGVRYEQLRRPREQGFQQAGGVIAAINEASGEQLWAVQLYETTFDPAEEQDAQEVYVSELSLDTRKGLLKAVDERKRVWLIRLSDGSPVQQ
jgi:hypothetical protein